MKILYLMPVLICFAVSSGHAGAKEKDSEENRGQAGEVSGKNDADVASKLGVDDFLVRISGAGYMLDIRYRVVDADKAKETFFKGGFQPFIVQESTGSRFTVPASAKVGFMRQRPKTIQNDRMYFMMVANPGKTIQPGETVTLEIGDVKIPGLKVY